MRILITILCAAFLISLCGCTTAGPETEGLTATVQGTESEEIMTAYLSERSGENSICVAYPVIPSAGTDAVNAAISDFILQETERLCRNECNVTNSEEKPADASAEYSMYLLELDYRVASFSDEMLSIIFEGFFNYKKAAHPIHVFFSLNIDPVNGQEICFADRYAVDDALYDVFAAYAQEDITARVGGTWPENWGAFSEIICGRDDFLSGLTSPSDFYVFYTDEGVGISYPVPYSMGNHLEIVLPYSELREISETGK